MGPEYRYDVVLSFAGEDRSFVLEVVQLVKKAGLNVFYDQDEQVDLWGEDLTEYLPKIYEQQARYAVLFVSRHYAAKPWTRLERRSILARALNESKPYMLPVRLDDTELDGVRSTVSYLNGAALGPKGVAESIARKLSGAPPTDGSQFNGFVPRTEHEVTILVGERPTGWEYMLYSYALVAGVERLNDRYLDHKMGFAPQGEFVATDQVDQLIEREEATFQSIRRNFESVLSSSVQESAFGRPGPSGSPGSVDHIFHLASRYVGVYESFIDWTARLRGIATPTEEAHDALIALAEFAQQPVERLRAFTYEVRDLMDPMSARMDAGEKVELVLRLPLEVSAAAISKFQKAHKRFRRSARYR